MGFYFTAKERETGSRFSTRPYLILKKFRGPTGLMKGTRWISSTAASTFPFSNRPPFLYYPAAFIVKTKLTIRIGPEDGYY